MHHVAALRKPDNDKDVELDPTHAKDGALDPMPKTDAYAYAHIKGFV